MGLMTVKSTPILMFLKGVAASTDTHCYFTIFIVEFVTTARTPAPVFTLAIAGCDLVFLRPGIMPRSGILVVSGHRRTFRQEASSIKCDSAS